eukprot:5875499-Amphidinium_carterae.1
MAGLRAVHLLSDSARPETPLPTVEGVLGHVMLSRSTISPSQVLRPPSKVGCCSMSVQGYGGILIWLPVHAVPLAKHVRLSTCRRSTRWRWGSGRSERWILLYNGEDNEVDHYVWGTNHTQQVETFCEDVTSWMKVLQAIGAIEKQTEEFCKVHIRWEAKKCADPRLGDFPAFVQG